MSLFKVVQRVNTGVAEWKGNKENLTPLYLPDANGDLRMYGLIPDKVSKVIKWEKHGFALVTAAGRSDCKDDFPKNHKRVVPILPSPSKDKTDGEWISDNFEAIYEELCSDARILQQLEGLEPGKKREHACVVAGDPNIQIPNLLAIHLGIVTAGIHLTLYTRDEKSKAIDKIWVQQRSESDNTSYPGMLDQTVGGGVTYSHSFYTTLLKETSEEMKNPEMESLFKKGLEEPGLVTFYDLRIPKAKKLAGLLEPGIRACYSLEVNKDFIPVPGEEAVKSFRAYTVEQVKTALRENEFKPNCGLVMLKFLADHKVITEKDGDLKKISEGLRCQLPFPVEPLGEMGKM